MKCPTCQNETLNRQVNNIQDTAIGITLFLNNQCMRCGTVFRTVAEYALKKEILAIVEGEVVKDDPGEDTRTE